MDIMSSEEARRLLLDACIASDVTDTALLPLVLKDMVIRLDSASASRSIIRE